MKIQEVGRNCEKVGKMAGGNGGQVVPGKCDVRESVVEVGGSVCGFVVQDTQWVE